MVAVLLRRFWFLRWHLHTKFDPCNIQALLEPLFLWVALTVTGKVFLWQHHSVFLFCELLHWWSRFSKVVLYNSLLYLHFSRNTWPGVFRLRGTGPWVAPLCLAWVSSGGPGLYNPRARAHGPWLGGGQLGQEEGLSREQSPDGNCPAVGRQPTPSPEVKTRQLLACLSWLMGFLSLTPPLRMSRCSNPSSGME